MKIIKEGKIRKKVLGVGECSACGAVFECDESDVVRTGGFEYVDCPTEGCGTGISISCLYSQQSLKLESDEAFIRRLQQMSWTGKIQ